MKRIDKNFLGGIFKLPVLKELKYVFRGKFGYLPREDSIEDLSGQSISPSDLPYIPPRCFPRIRSF